MYIPYRACGVWISWLNSPSSIPSTEHSYAIKFLETGKLWPFSKHKIGIIQGKTPCCLLPMQMRGSLSCCLKLTQTNSTHLHKTTRWGGEGRFTVLRDTAGAWWVSPRVGWIDFSFLLDPAKAEKPVVSYGFYQPFNLSHIQFAYHQSLAQLLVQSVSDLWNPKGVLQQSEPLHYRH